jgi:hypothetical protein
MPSMSGIDCTEVSVFGPDQAALGPRCARSAVFPALGYCRTPLDIGTRLRSVIPPGTSPERAGGSRRQNIRIPTSGR